MSLLIGTDEGLYRIDDIPFEMGDAEEVLDCGMVTDIRQFPGHQGVFATSTEGAYRSLDGGSSWEDLGVPIGDRFWHAGASEVWSILGMPDGTLFAGTNDPYLFKSTDDAESWMEVKSFREIPSRGHWESPIDPHYARLRSLEQIPGEPHGLIVGVEAGGIHTSYDGGRTWNDYRDRIVDDIHQILPITDRVWLAATGYLDHDLEALGLGHAVADGGLHRTTDAGETWERLDVGNNFSYIRRVYIHDGRVLFGGGEEAPPAWVEDEHTSALFESTNFCRDIERVSYPGEPHEVVEAWVEHEGELLCGSGLFDVPDQRDDVDGRLMRRNDDGTYETVGKVSANIGHLGSV